MGESLEHRFRKWKNQTTRRIEAEHAASFSQFALTSLHMVEPRLSEMPNDASVRALRTIHKNAVLQVLALHERLVDIAQREALEEAG